MKRRTTVAGAFDDHTATVDAINELRQLGFSDDQLGFVVRVYVNRENSIDEHTPNPAARGILSGLLGAADVLLLPLQDTKDTSTALSATAVIEDGASDRFSNRNSSQTIPSQALSANVSVSEAALLPKADLGRESTTITSKGEKQNVPGNHDTNIITGGVIGGTMGAVASLLLPDIGLVIAGGVLAAILGSAESGGIIGGFLSMGIPEQKAHYYEQQFQAGHIILTVRANKDQQEARDILHHHGALSIEVH